MVKQIYYFPFVLVLTVALFVVGLNFRAIGNLWQAYLSR